MPKYGDQEDTRVDEQKYIEVERKLKEATDTLVAYQEASAKAEQEHLETISKERAERRDAESRAFRAEVALQEVLKHVTKIK